MAEVRFRHIDWGFVRTTHIFFDDLNLEFVDCWVCLTEAAYRLRKNEVSVPYDIG
jgi:hypothetical protein